MQNLFRKSSFVNLKVVKKISVITINKNNAEGLEKTIRSVIEQDFIDYEYIIIDGNSIDRSCDIIRKYANCISYWISEKDDGIYHAMNKGIAQANGEYCLFLNSGDYLFSRNVLKEYSGYNITGEIITGNAIVDMGEKGTELVLSPKEVTFYTFFKHTILHQATFIKRSLFDKFGYYNTNLKIVADWEFVIKVLCLFNCNYQSIPLTISVFDTAGMSSRPNNMTICIKEREQVLKQYFSTFLPDYKLIKEKPVYDFLNTIENKRKLKNGFISLFRILNRLITD